MLAEADDTRWTETERNLVVGAAESAGARSLAVLQSVARMYGEEPPQAQLPQSSEPAQPCPSFLKTVLGPAPSPCKSAQAPT